jgi:hypothetical protein
MIPIQVTAITRERMRKEYAGCGEGTAVEGLKSPSAIRAQHPLRIAPSVYDFRCDGPLSKVDSSFCRGLLLAAQKSSILRRKYSPVDRTASLKELPRTFNDGETQICLLMATTAFRPQKSIVLITSGHGRRGRSSRRTEARSTSWTIGCCGLCQFGKLRTLVTIF